MNRLTKGVENRIDEIIELAKNTPFIILVICNNKTQTKETIKKIFEKTEYSNINAKLQQYYGHFICPSGGTIIVYSTLNVCGLRAHFVYYDDNIDEVIINTIIKPCANLPFSYINKNK